MAVEPLLAQDRDLRPRAEQRRRRDGVAAGEMEVQAYALGNLARTDERASVQLQRECLRLLVEAEQGEDTRADFDRLVGEDRVVLDMLWALTRVEP